MCYNHLSFFFPSQMKPSDTPYICPGKRNRGSVGESSEDEDRPSAGPVFEVPERPYDCNIPTWRRIVETTEKHLQNKRSVSVFARAVKSSIYSTTGWMDLHGFLLKEVLLLVDLHLQEMKKIHLSVTEIVTGRGNHSEHPVIKYIVHLYLTRKGYRFQVKPSSMGGAVLIFLN